MYGVRKYGLPYVYGSILFSYAKVQIYLRTDGCIKYSYVMYAYSVYKLHMHR